MATTTYSGPASTRSDRVLSLDIARGLTIAFMIMVNNHGISPYHPFTHSEWSGWTPTDLVFPGFLFMVGASIVLAFDKKLERGVPKHTIAVNIVRRSVILFALGLVVNGLPLALNHEGLGAVRIYGVLQRIAVCYLCVGLFYLWKQDVTTKIGAIVVLLMGYWVLMRYVPVPGVGVPTRDIPLLDPNQNWVVWVDRKLLPGRLSETDYFLSTLPAIGTTLLGVLAAIWLQVRKSREQITAGFIAAGVALIGLGQLWDLSFPINKKLWTSSYVLFAGGCAVLLLGLLYWLVDVKRWGRALKQPWIVFGTNAIFAYMLSALLYETLWDLPFRRNEPLLIWLYKPSFSHIYPAGVGSLLYSIVFTAVCWLGTYFLWRRRIFLKL